MNKKAIITKVKNVPGKALNYLKTNKKQILSCLTFILIMSTLNSYADFWSESVDTLKKIVKGIGAGLGIWGIINLLEGYGNDNPAAKNQGIKQLVAGGGIFFLADKIVETLKTVFQ